MSMDYRYTFLFIKLHTYYSQTLKSLLDYLEFSV